MSLLWMEYETEFEHLVENGDHAQYHPDDGRNHSGREKTESVIRTIQQKIYFRAYQIGRASCRERVSSPV